MGNTLEIWTRKQNSDNIGYYYYELIWSGEEEEVAFVTFKHLKATGEHQLLKLEWR